MFKVTVHQKDLYDAVRHLPKNDKNMVVLDQIQLSITADTLQLHSTNLDLHYVTQINCMTAGSGSVLVDAKQFQSIVKSTSGRCELSCDSTTLAVNMSKLRCQDPMDMPCIPDLPGTPRHSLQYDLIYPFLTLIDVPDKYSLSTSDTAILLDDNKLVMITDGTVLTILDTLLPKSSHRLIPKSALLFIKKLLKKTDSLTIQHDVATLVCSIDDTTDVYARLIGGSYPDYPMLIPERGESIHIPKQQLLSALKLAATVVDKKYVGSNFSFVADTLQIETCNPGKDLYTTDTISVSCETGYTEQWGFNTKKLLKLIRTVPDDVVIFAMPTESEMPVLIENINSYIMPMRV